VPFCGKGFGLPVVGDHADAVGSTAFQLSLLAIPGDFGNLFCGPLPASFSQRPTRHIRFVANKRRNAIRPSGHRAVEASFSCFLPG
jgi:hypothetical protein